MRLIDARVQSLIWLQGQRRWDISYKYISARLLRFNWESEVCYIKCVEAQWIKHLHYAVVNKPTSHIYTVSIDVYFLRVRTKSYPRLQDIWKPFSELSLNADRILKNEACARRWRVGVKHGCWFGFCEVLIQSQLTGGPTGSWATTCGRVSTSQTKKKHLNNNISIHRYSHYFIYSKNVHKTRLHLTTEPGSANRTGLSSRIRLPLEFSH